MRSLMGVGVAVSAAAAMIFANVSPAQADGMQCGRMGGSLCTKVIGKGLYVNQIKVSGALPCRQGVIYHYQATAPGWSFSTPDATYECNPIPSGTDSGWIPVEKSFPDRSLVCGRLWYKEGQRFIQNGEQCVTLRA